MNVAVVGVTRESLALARALIRDGADVTIAETHSTDPALARPRGAAFAANVAALDPRAFTTVYVDTYVGLHPQDPWLERARAHGTVISNHADYVFRHARVAKLGVTGSAGKTSTTALTAHLLRASGVRVHIATDTRPETNLWPNYELIERPPEPPGVLVAELTSTYLEHMSTSPEVAVVTNLWPDHVDDHGSYDRYVDAKRTILRHQDASGCAVLNGDDARVLDAFLPECRGRVVCFGSEPEHFVGVDGDHVVVRTGEGVVDLGPVPGEPRFRSNVLGACAAALVAGGDADAIREALPTFGGVPFRRHCVGEFGGIRAYNDGMATTPVKARVGLETFSEPVVWIAGGRATFPREELHSSDVARADLRVLAAEARTRAKAVVVFGEAAPRLRAVLEGVDVHEARDFEDAVARAGAITDEGDIVVFAPVFYVPLEDRARFDSLIAGALIRA